MASSNPGGFTINCPTCQRPLLVGVEQSGQTVACPHCGGHLMVPQTSAEYTAQPLTTPVANVRATPHAIRRTRPSRKLGLAVSASMLTIVVIAILTAGIIYLDGVNRKPAKASTVNAKQGTSQPTETEPKPVIPSSLSSNADASIPHSEPPASLATNPDSPTPKAPTPKATVDATDLIQTIIDEGLVNPRLLSPRSSLLGHPDDLLRATILLFAKRQPITSETTWAVCGIQPFDLRYDQENSLATCRFVGGGPRLYTSSVSKFSDGEVHRVALNRAEKTEPWAMKKDGSIVELPSYREAANLIESGGVVYYAEATTTQLELTFFATPDLYKRLNKGFQGLTADVAFSSLSAYESQRKCFYRSDAMERLKNNCEEIEKFNTTGLFDEGNAPSCYVVDNAEPRMVAHAQLVGFRLKMEDGTIVLDSFDTNECNALAYPAPSSGPAPNTKRSPPQDSNGPDTSAVKPESGAMAEASHTEQAVCEEGVGTSFSESGEKNAELVGVEVTTARFGRRFQGIAIGAIRPLFRTKDRLDEGTWHGTLHGDVQRLVAKPGYTLTGLDVSTGGRVMGLNLHFSDAAGDTYSSGWVGEKTAKVTTIRVKPSTCVGLFGSSKKEVSGEWPTTIRSLGLIALTKGEHEAADR